ncbi:hypothetical protein J7E83_12915 [Arthrobacter sp. ISL-48]|uniref:hypothetical protein n=1 Tax=Arthrobacter sp. ISL-48 TaxID=2819110 RepID=UPI001BE5EAE5|nr:hypothetical protein [Arthrobacter sp. ISL-48]MBT2533004.1 hypothetical protein [Arthrobacter sp. ISL-48]
MITERIHQMLVGSDASGTSSGAHRVERFPKGRITSSPWEGWWHEEPRPRAAKHNPADRLRERRRVNPNGEVSELHSNDKNR